MGTTPSVKSEDPKAESKQLTAAEAAKRVKRPRTEYVDGTDANGGAIKVSRTKLVAVTADEVLSFKDYGTHVVVVTKDGQKLTSADGE